MSAKFAVPLNRGPVASSFSRLISSRVVLYIRIYYWKHKDLFIFWPTQARDQVKSSLPHLLTFICQYGYHFHQSLAYNTACSAIVCLYCLYCSYLFSIHEKANCIAIFWTVSPHSLGSCHFRDVWATCLPHKGGGVPLSALPKDTTSELAGLFSTISHKCRAPSREAVDTTF